MSAFTLRTATDRDRPALAALICDSTNAWYAKQGKPAIFPGGPATTTLFAEVYETLDPGCCVVAEDPVSGRLMGSCFFHPRPTHVALGIMNVHPDFFGAGVARAAQARHRFGRRVAQASAAGVECPEPRFVFTLHPRRFRAALYVSGHVRRRAGFRPDRRMPRS